jgi:hypothetical protein
MILTRYDQWLIRAKTWVKTENRFNQLKLYMIVVHYKFYQTISKVPENLPQVKAQDQVYRILWNPKWTTTMICRCKDTPTAIWQ